MLEIAGIHYLRPICSILVKYTILEVWIIGKQSAKGRDL
jgi:hypothetical protein